MKIKKKNKFHFFGGVSGTGGSDQRVGGVGEGGSKVWGRLVMWGMETCNQE